MRSTAFVRVSRELHLAAIALAAAAMFGCAAPPITNKTAASSDQGAVTLLMNARVLTMNDATPNAEAVAIKNGKILAVGGRADVAAIAGPSAVVRDMKGRTVVPGLIDAHGHFANVAQALSMADVQPPPAGGVGNLSDIRKVLMAWRAEHPNAAWIQGRGYDDSLLAEKRHPTRDDLDAMFPNTPVVLVHASGHLLTCNSACLAASGVTAATEDPKGGVIRRKPGSREPNGVFEETALRLVLSHAPDVTAEQTQANIKLTQAYYAHYGITTIQEGAASPKDVAAIRTFADTGNLKLDVVAYVQHSASADVDPSFTASRSYDRHFRVGGIKLILDGSPQGKTAWLSHPYLTPPPGRAADYRGYGTLDQAQLDKLLGSAFARNIQVLAHANGDAAIDQMTDAVARANAKLGRADRRPVIIHAQTSREDQLDKMKLEGIVPSFFVAHTFFWGDWHRDSVLGPERAARISPLKSAGARSIAYTIHNDAPVVPPDMMRLIWAAVNRTTRSGQTLGADQRVSPLEALKAVTLSAARQYFEEDRKGSIEVGKLADLTVLSADPTGIAPDKIKDIAILETIKDGETVYAASR